MLLHSASRLGVISYLYQNRHDIAHRIGLIVEIPVAVCNSDYSFSKNPIIYSPGDDEKLPVNFQAREIILFFQDTGTDLLLSSVITSEFHFTALVESGYASPSDLIFHPPC
jgi:hypothetical protein